MSRKRKGKKFSKEEFITKVCINRCFICQSENLDPVFCYTQLYRKKPKAFLELVLENYMDFWQELAELQESTTISDEVSMNLFRKVVCDTNLCKRCCAADFDVYLCLSKFLDQNDMLTTRSWKTAPKRKPTPFLFMHKDIKFNEEIDRILENYPKQQNLGGGIITGY